MRHAVLFVPTLLTIVLMSAVHVAMAADHAVPKAIGQKSRQDWRRAEGPASFSVFANTLVRESGGGTRDFLLVEDEYGISEDGNAAPKALGRDWRGLG